MTADDADARKMLHGRSGWLSDLGPPEISHLRHRCQSAARAHFYFCGNSPLEGPSRALVESTRRGQRGHDLPVEPDEPLELAFQQALLIAVHAVAERLILEVHASA